MKVKIIREVYSKKQRKFFCASDDPELKSMCDDPMKEGECNDLDEEKIEEMSSMGGAAVGGPSGIDDYEEDSLEEMYSSKGSMAAGEQRIISGGDDPEGVKERGRAQKVQNFKENQNYFHNQWRVFLKD